MNTVYVVYRAPIKYIAPYKLVAICKTAMIAEAMCAALNSLSVRAGTVLNENTGRMMNEVYWLSKEDIIQ